MNERTYLSVLKKEAESQIIFDNRWTSGTACGIVGAANGSTGVKQRERMMNCGKTNRRYSDIIQHNMGGITIISRREY